jgi:UDP-glucose 4-epimerase
MKILFTGGSSFTGSWFVRELHRAGHEVTAIFRRKPEEYPDELRRRRASELTRHCRPIYGCSFGDDTFLKLIDEGGWDALCHHAADVTDYKSPDFDYLKALGANGHSAAKVLHKCKAAGCRRIVVTGSVFENDEGAGSEGLPAFSPYGLSKGLTWQVFRYFGLREGLHVGKFLIPNPFGPDEEPRFTAYLMKNWFAGKSAAVNTPVYVRDNIHISLLAKCYAQFVQTLPESPGLSKLGPTGYPESQGAFTLRFASEMRSRLNMPCEVELKKQIDFSEPRIRINTDIPAVPDWDESGAWDAMAIYYQQFFNR